MRFLPDQAGHFYPAGTNFPTCRRKELPFPVFRLALPERCFIIGGKGFYIMMFSLRHLIRTFILVMTTVLLWGAEEGGAATINKEDIVNGLLPHKALYDINMVSKSSGAQVLNISGQMFFEWQPDCEAWTTNHQFKLLYEYADTSPMHITSDFSTYENYDSQSFDFTSRRKRNGKLYQELRGRASMDQDEKGEALFSMPEGLSFDLPAGTLFPVSHTLELLRRAKTGKKFFHATVFDGSDEDGPVEINAFIGKPVNAMANLTPSPDMDTALINTLAWNVRMAFFPLLNPDSDADYEMDVVFHENGVISDMLVEYKNFSVTQKLVAIEKLEKKECKAVK